MIITIMISIGIVVFGLIVFWVLATGLSFFFLSNISPRRSQRMMQYRILFQGGAVTLSMLLSYWIWS